MPNKNTYQYCILKLKYIESSDKVIPLCLSINLQLKDKQGKKGENTLIYTLSIRDIHKEYDWCYSANKMHVYIYVYAKINVYKYRTLK